MFLIELFAVSFEEVAVITYLISWEVEEFAGALSKTIDWTWSAVLSLTLWISLNRFVGSLCILEQFLGEVLAFDEVLFRFDD